MIETFLKPLPKASTRTVYDRLLSLGYIDEDEHTPLIEAIAKFQEFNGLVVDSNCGPKTERMMLYTPRCGVSDIQRAGLCKFPHKDVRFWHDLSFRGLSRDEVNAAFVEGFTMWNRISGLEAYLVDNVRDANVYAYAKLIDGGGGTLAWSYLSCGANEQTQLEQRFDTGENWSYESLVATSGHETGHALGFDHSPNRTSLMYAYSNVNVNKPSDEDIRGAVKRYGEFVPTEPTDPVDPPVDDWPTIEGTILIDGKPHIVIRKIEYKM